jgi:hypothetical protein
MQTHLITPTGCYPCEMVDDARYGLVLVRLTWWRKLLKRVTSKEGR